MRSLEAILVSGNAAPTLALRLQFLAVAAIRDASRIDDHLPRVYLKLFEKLYAPLTSAILEPVKHDRRLVDLKTSPLDKLYRAVVISLDQLVDAVGLKVA